MFSYMDTYVTCTRTWTWTWTRSWTWTKPGHGQGHRHRHICGHWGGHGHGHGQLFDRHIRPFITPLRKLVQKRNLGWFFLLFCETEIQAQRAAVLQEVPLVSHPRLSWIRRNEMFRDTMKHFAFIFYNLREQWWLIREQWWLTGSSGGSLGSSGGS